MKPNMTSMIDVVFLLIVFFLLVMDLSQRDLERLELPLSRYADVERTRERPVMVNVDHDGRTTIRGEELRGANLDRALALEARGMRQAWDAERGAALPDDPLRIRADANAPMEAVEDVMRSSVEQSIWKLDLGARRGNE